MKRTIAILLASVGVASAGFVSSPTPNDGLVAWYTFEGDISSTVSNIYSDAHHGTVTGNIVQQQSTHGQGIRFTNTLGYVSLGDTVISNNGPFTVAMWMSNINGLSGSFINRGRDGAGNGWSVAVDGNRMNIVAQGASGTPAAAGFPTPSVAVPAARWSHIAGVWRPGESVTFILNGGRAIGVTNVPSTYTTLRSSTAGAFIGSWLSGGVTNNAIIHIDDLRVWNRALSNAEITALFWRRRHIYQ